MISEIIKVDDTYRDLENSGYHKIESNNVLLYIVLKKITTNKPSHRTQFNIALKNHALHAQPTD